MLYKKTQGLFMWCLYHGKKSNVRAMVRNYKVNYKILLFENLYYKIHVQIVKKKKPFYQCYKLHNLINKTANYSGPFHTKGCLSHAEEG